MASRKHSHCSGSRLHFYKPQICCTSNGKQLIHCYTRCTSSTIYLMSALIDGLTTPSLIFLHPHLCKLCFISTLKSIKPDTLQNHKHHHGKKSVFLQSTSQLKFISKSLYLGKCVCADTQAEISALEKNVNIHTKISGDSLFSSCLPITAHRRLKDTLPN